MSSFPLRLSSPAEEGVLRASKWLKHQVLLDEEEMADLFAHIDPFCIYAVSEVVSPESCAVTPAEFLEKYREYVRCLKAGALPDEKGLKRYFSAVLSVTPDVLYGMRVGENKYLVKALKPVIQLQAHHFFISAVDEKLYPMVLSEESVTWGLQISYPQLAQHPKTHLFAKVDSSPEFPNTALFAKVAKWLRFNTAPTPFIWKEKKMTAPIRLGKKCAEWISKHPQLLAKGIVYGR